MSKITSIQRRDIDDTFSKLREVEDSVNERYHEQYPDLLDEMDNLIEEQKRILSGYDYRITSNAIEVPEERNEQMKMRAKMSQTYHGSDMITAGRAREQPLSDALEDEMQRQIERHLNISGGGGGSGSGNGSSSSTINNRSRSGGSSGSSGSSSRSSSRMQLMNDDVTHEDEFPVEFMHSNREYGMLTDDGDVTEDADP